MRPLLPISLLLVVLVVLVYQQVGGHDFVDLDDYIYVVENPNLRAGLTLEAATRAFTEPYETNWIPLTWISLAWDGRDFFPADRA